MTASQLFNRIMSSNLADRLDAEYYSKELLENETKIEQFNEITLENAVDSNFKNAICDLTSNGSFEFLRGISFNIISGIPYIRTQNLMDGYIDDGDIIFVDKSCASMVAKSMCKNGDLVVCRKGKVGAASAINMRMDGSAISENVTRFRLLPNHDVDFISAFLNSKHGRMRFLREATGVIQKWINNEKLRQIRIIQCDAHVEKYIGDKVRQAEQLRDWAKGLELEFTRILSKNYPEAFVDRRSEKKHSKAPIDEISYTLNPGAFDEERLRIRAYLKLTGAQKLRDLVSIQGPTTADYELETVYVGLDAISSNSCALSVSSVGASGVKGTSRLLTEGPVVAKLRPYLNKVAYIPAKYSGAIGSTELLCVQPMDEISSWYLYGALKSEITLKQIRTLASGSTHPRIDQYDLYDVVLPVHPEHETMGEMLQRAQCAYFFSKDLTSTAKFLVEALIEGHLTEQQLMDAQQALEAGDDSLDRAILAQLTSQGFNADINAVSDTNSQPLFSDLDELYRLLEQAQEAVHG